MAFDGFPGWLYYARSAMDDKTLRHLKVASSAEVREGAGIAVLAEGTPVALFRVEGRCHAIANACPHKGGPLAEGELEGHVVTCPWHGWTWDVRTGQNVRQPRLKGVPCFAVTEENGEVFIALP
jgi:nitrite reductase (NADH) small subunit